MSIKQDSQVYFDYAATTPLDPRVIKVMTACMEDEFGNAASRSHAFGWKAQALIDTAREQVAQLIHADSREIVWTSGATESNNLALKGAAHFYQQKGKHIITSQIEHKAVLDTARQLEREGFEVTYLKPNNLGKIEVEAIKAAIRPDTILVSIMHVNNEIGVIQDVEAIGALTRAHNILFHVDAAQSAGKIELDMEKMHANIDLLSISAHKLYGPKGIGALYVRRKPRVRLSAQMHGGGHERGMRSGTLATHQIVGMGEACRIAQEEYKEEGERLGKLRDRLWDGIKDIERIQINGDVMDRLPNILNFSIHFIEGESLIMGLKDFAISSGSACTSASLEPSYVLKALGLPDELAHSSLRFSLGRFTNEAEIDAAIAQIHVVVKRLRDLSPLWDMYKEGIDLNTIVWAEH